MEGYWYCENTAYDFDIIKVENIDEVYNVENVRVVMPEGDCDIIYIGNTLERIKKKFEYKNLISGFPYFIYTRNQMFKPYRDINKPLTVFKKGYSMYAKV